MGVVAYWGEIPLVVGNGAALRYVRARGLEASVSVVTMLLDVFRAQVPGALLAPFDPTRFAEGGRGAPGASPMKVFQIAAEEIPGSGPKPGGDGLPYRGDLVVSDVDGVVGVEPAPTVRVFRARSLFMSGAQVVTAHEPVLVEVALVDIRKWWDDFGEITEDFNQPLPDHLAKDESSGASIIERRWVAGTAEETGTKPRPLRKIIQRLLDRLPGKLQILRWPSTYADALEPAALRCWGASPKDVLRALLTHTGLELDIGHDLQARIFAPGEGTVGEADDGSQDNVRAHDPVTWVGEWSSSIVEDGDNYQQRNNDDASGEVLVIGDRTECTVSVDYLEPVIWLDGKATEVTPANMRALCLDLPQPEAAGPVAAGAVLPPKKVPTAFEAAVTSLATTSTKKFSAAPARTNRFTGAFAVDGPITAAAAKLKSEIPLPGASPAPVDQADTTEPQAEDDVNDETLWQKIPLLGGRAWPSLFSVKADTRKLLEAQLFRVYRVPKNLRRLLPILNRAERTREGRRLGPQVEIARYTSIKVQVAPPQPTGPDRAAIIAQMQAWSEEIQQLLAYRDQVRGVSLPELVEKARELTATQREDFVRAIAGNEQGAATSVAGFAYDVFDALYPQELLVLLDEEVRDRLFNKSLPSLVTNLAGQPNPIEEAQKVADELIAQRRKDMAEAAALLDPTIKLEQDLLKITDTIARLRKAGASIPDALTVQEFKARDALNQARLKRADLVPKEAERPEEIIQHVNLPGRSPAPFRVLDANEGIIEILGPDLPGWLLDPSVPVPEMTLFVPMPVRLTFGTTNEQDVRGEVTQPSRDAGSFENLSHYVRVGAGLAKADDKWSAVVGSLGHVLPKHVGAHQARFAFTRADGLTGQAELGPYPWRIVDEDLKYLIALDGSSNQAETLARAQTHARPVLHRALVGEGGTLTVIGARTVVCNGRISAVEIKANDKGTVTHTTVSFESDLEPLLGVVGAVRDRGPFSGVFGVDVKGRAGT